MKKTAILFSLIVCSIFTYAQELPYAWNRTVQLVSPVGNATYSIIGSATDNTGILYLVGQFTGTCNFDPNGSATLTSLGSTDIFFAKYNSDGQLMGSPKQVGGTGAESAGSVVYDGVSSLFFTGAFSGTVDFNPGIGVNNLTSAGGTDTFVARFDTDGQYLGAASVGGTGSEVGMYIRYYGGDIYLTGYFTGTSDFDPQVGVTSLTSTGATADIFMARYTTAATLVWAKSIGSGVTDSPSSFRIADNSVYIGVSVFNSVFDFDPSASVTSFTGVNGTTDFGFAKYDLSGNLTWARVIGGPGVQTGTINAIDGSGVYIAGRFEQTVDLDPGLGVSLAVNTGGSDAFVCQLNSSGDLVWSRVWSSTGITNCSVQQVTGAGLVLVTGSFEGNLDIDPTAGTTNVVSAGATDGYFARLNSSGSFLDGFSMGGPLADPAPGLLSDGTRIFMSGVYGSAIDLDPTSDVNGAPAPTPSAQLFATVYTMLAPLPTAQPAAFTPGTITSGSIDFSFTAAAGTPTGYLVVRKKGSSPTGTPKDGFVYFPGSLIGDGTVIQASTAVSGTAQYLAANTSYHFDVFAYNGTGDAINYRVVSPLEASAATSVASFNRASDSTALRAFYDANSGSGWSSPWNTAQPITTWAGVTVSGGRVTSLNLSSRNIFGTIPPQLGNLTALTSLDLSGNFLSDGIPSELSSLTLLTTLALNVNGLSGNIPIELFNLTSLTSLNLASNNLTGTLPTQIGNLTALTLLNFGSNKFAGPIPVEVGSLTALTDLRFNNNGLTGSLPTQLGSLTSLTLLDLHSNKLSGTIPPVIGTNLSSLSVLRLDGNGITGSIPIEFGSLSSLTELYLNDNKLSGAVPAQLTTITGLIILDLSTNSFTGAIPSQITNLTALQFLDLHSNRLADLPDLSGMTSLATLKVNDNVFTFEDLEPNASQFSGTSDYSPQKVFGSPSTQTLQVGQALNLSFAVGGASTNYQWKRGVTPVGTSSNTYSVPSVTSADAGNYVLELTNSVLSGLTIASETQTVNVKNEGLFTWHNGGALTSDGFDASLNDGVNDPAYYGGSWGDINNDGFDDIYLAGIGYNTRNFIYRNNGNGTFSRLPYSAHGFEVSRAPVLADADNDGFADIYAPDAGGFANPDSINNVSAVYKNNGNLTFSPVALPLEANAYNGAWLDFNNDGKLDLISISTSSNATLYQNNGGFNFSAQFPFSVGGQWHVTAVDYDNDGDLDVFFPADGNGQRQIFKNNGNGTFTAQSSNLITTDAANVNRHGSWGDIDNDGDYDLYSVQATENVFFINDGAGNFTKQTATTVLGEIVAGGRGSVFLDYDNDGFIDLFTYQSLVAPGVWLLFKNNGNGTFTKQTNQSFKIANAFVGASVADFNNDGFLDIFSASFGFDTNGLYKNNSNGNHWLQVKLRGTLSNRDAIGAKVSIKAGGTWRHQQIITTNGVSSQSTLVAQFGLGASTQADSVKIKWPSGISQFLLAVPGNQRITITEFSAALTSDSLALVDLYNATGGASWKVNTNWLTGPINTWSGVTITNGRVTALTLNQNNLTGTLPVSIGTLTSLTQLRLSTNKITGAIPSSIGNLAALTVLELNDNLITSVPIELNNLDALQALSIAGNNLADLPLLTGMATINNFNVNNNLLTFEDIAPLLGVPGINYSYQRNIPVGGLFNIPVGGALNLTATIGGTGNVYQWRKFFVNIPGATSSSYSVGSTTISDAGAYSLVVTNPGVPNLTITTTDFNVEILSLSAGDDSGYSFLKKLGAETLAINQILPEGRASIDNLGNYYFVKAGNGSVIYKANSAGTILYNFLSGNADIGGTDIAIDAANAVYVPGVDYATMKKFNAAGTLVYETPPIAGSRPFQTLVVNLDGSILAMDLSTAPLVKRFDANTGNLLGQITLTGGPVGFYNSVFDMGIDASGNIYVPDGNRVDKFSSAGAFIASIDVSMVGGWGGLIFQIASNGHMYLAPWYSGNTIYHFDNTGSLVGSFSFEDYTSYASLTITPSNELLASSQLGVLRFDLNGNFLGFIDGRNANGQFSSAADVAIDSKGNRYVVDKFNHRVQKFTPAGTFTSSFGTKGAANGQFNFPNAIAIDKTDNVFVVDGKNNRVQKFSVAGVHQLSFGTPGNGNGQFNNPVAIAIAKTGEILVADKGNSRVHIFKPDGTFDFAFGTNGTGQGQFTNLQALAVENDGNILTSDGQARLQRFTSKGVFISELNMYGPLTAIAQIKTDIDGFFYVPTGGIAKKFDKNGGLITTIGLPPTTALTDGELRSISLSSNLLGDTVWVADGNSTNRMSVFAANFRKASASDSLALVDLFNSTKGASWTNKTNWLTGSVNTWHGVQMNAGKIRKLNLTSNNLDGPLPPSIVSLNDLTTLNLFNNKLSGAVPAWSGPSSLLDLDLSKNLFAGPATLLPIQAEKLDLSDNQITAVPDLPPFAVGADLSNNRITQLKNFVAANSLLDTLFVQNNQLTFEDLEPNISIPVFSYAPQDSADIAESVLKQVNATQTFTAAIGGTANSYQWKKKGVDVVGATSSSLTISNISFADDASYTYAATNSLVPGLTLNSKKKVLRVSSIQRDSLALRAFFNATGGTGWTTKTNWLSTPLSAGNWFGVTVSGNRVTAVNLPNNNLTGKVPAVFADVQNLVTVNLSSNKLEQLPDLRLLTNVTTLNVNNNKLDFASLIPNTAITGITYANQAEVGTPANELIDYGKDYTVKISTKGDGNVYQWKRNGTAVTGAKDSTYLIAAINRANMGDYVAEVTNAAVPGLTLKSANKKILATATLSGRVKETAETPVTNGKLTLFKITTVGAYDTMRIENINTDGTFTLKKVVLDDYTLLAVANATAYPDDLPSYYKNKLYWEEADKIIVNEDIAGLDILMQKKPTTKPQGQGVIAGVFYDTNPVGGRTLENRRIANAGASVRRKTNVGKPQEEVLTLIAYIFTDENGVFSFTNLETGDYLLNLQYPGYPMDPNSFITISIGTGLARSVEVDALVQGNKIVVNKRVVTGWDEEYSRFGVYPNPASSAFTIAVKEPASGLTYHITNTMGQQLATGGLPQIGTQAIDVAAFQPGVYQVQIRQQGANMESFRIVIAR